MRTICVVTGTRADYGLLYWLLREIQDDPGLRLQLVATGMHLSPEFGLTYRVIEEDGFTLDARVEMLTSSDTPVGVAKAIGLGTIGFADVFARLRPDIVTVLGDRYEILAAVTAAAVARLCVAHLHGGESSEGAVDEAFRHAITKMAHLHFTAAEPYRRRVIQMGESPARVFNVGAPGLDHLHRLPLLGRAELAEGLGLALDPGFFLVTYHPVTLENDTAGEHVAKLLKALDCFPDRRIAFTRSNADTGGRIIGHLLDAYAERNPGRCVVVTSLGQQRYLSAVKHADVVVGNSSSGLIEAPALHKATVNIGERQRGRLLADSVVQCGNEVEEIRAAIERALSGAFQATLPSVTNPYGVGGASRRIKDILKETRLDPQVIKKRFHVLGEPQ
jgi:UDP-N-acetylglucosamine 2-epimerase (non-hydrolysing)/GDP/UDP-N,N'-diacetylbacillosamine 2-epimerase (hydrolysing)